MESLSGALKGRTAVVTGGSRGYGRGIVEALAARGMRVVVIARDRDRLAALRKEIPGDLDTIAADATDAYTAATVVQRERPHLIVLNAGAMPAMRPTRLQTWETFSANWDTDVKHVFTWVREALLLPLVPGSAIVIMSSTAATSENPEISGYAAAKAALWRLSECLAVEAKPHGIRVVACFRFSLRQPTSGGSPSRISRAVPELRRPRCKCVSAYTTRSLRRRWAKRCSGF